MRSTLTGIMIAAVGGLWLASDAAAALADTHQGRYARRRAARGDLSDTSPKLDRFAFIQDETAEPHRLVLVVDTWVARAPRDARFLPLVIALSYEGDGDPLPIRPDRFELSVAGGPAMRALSHDDLVARAGSASVVLQDRRLLQRRAPLSFDTPRATPVEVTFHAHPALPELRNDRLWLASQRWFETLAYFEVPADFARWEDLMELRYVPVDGEPAAAACTFRIQRDPAAHQAALRRARRAIEREDAAARRAGRRNE